MQSDRENRKRERERKQEKIEHNTKLINRICMQGCGPQLMKNEKKYKK